MFRTRLLDMDSQALRLESLLRGSAFLTCSTLALLACGGERGSSDSSSGVLPGPSMPEGSGSLDAGDEGSTSGEGPAEGGDSASSSGSGETSNPGQDGSGGSNSSGSENSENSDNTENGDEGLRFDVPDSDDGQHALYCGGKDAGIYCEGNSRSYECSEDEKVSNFHQCGSGVCETGTGCVLCVEGQFSCLGSQVRQCDTSGDEPVWEVIDNCIAASQTCDTKTGTCINPEIIGTAEPTGVYYKFASEPIDRNSFDADSYDNLVYATNVSDIFVYEVNLLDSDGDGELEPNQHPDNPDHTGPIEERTVEHIDTISLADAPLQIEPGNGWVQNELYAQEDRLFYLGGVSGPKQIVEYVFATGTFNIVSSVSPGAVSQLGYDDLRDIWYASVESRRGVYQYDPKSDTWGLAFLYPHLAGAHMDGLEVVTQQTSDNEGRIQWGETYVYVSDMTSDFIGQYRYDANEGWVQENLFEYNDDTGNSVEGMGFGYLNHFWVAAYGELYELGGGDLAKYVEPIG